MQAHRYTHTHTHERTMQKNALTHTHTNSIGLRILQNFYIRICLDIQTDAFVRGCAFM